MAEIIVPVRIMDMPEFKAFADQVNAKIEELVRERDEARREAEEWEERYEWLLGECGGVAPQ